MHVNPRPTTPTMPGSSRSWTRCSGLSTYRSTDGPHSTASTTPNPRVTCVNSCGRYALLRFREPDARRELQVPGVDGFLDLLGVGNLVWRVADEQGRDADYDGHSRHPQQAVGVAVVKRMQLRIVHEPHRAGGTAQVQRARGDHGLDDGQHKRTAQALQHQRERRYRADPVKADTGDRRQGQRDNADADAYSTNDDGQYQVGEVGNAAVHERPAVDHRPEEQNSAADRQHPWRKS